MRRSWLRFLAALLLLTSLGASQLPLTPSSSPGGNESTDPSIVEGTRQIDWILPSARESLRPPVGWLARAPSATTVRVASESARINLTNSEHTRRTPDRRVAIHRHIPRMHAGDDRPPRASTNT